MAGLVALGMSLLTCSTRARSQLVRGRASGLGSEWLAAGGLPEPARRSSCSRSVAPEARAARDRSTRRKETIEAKRDRDAA